MEVNILELAKNCPGVAITVRAEDLINANAMLIAETRRAMESEANTKKEVTLLTCEEVTQRLNVAPSTLWRWKKKGYPFVPVSVNVSRRDFLEEGCIDKQIELIDSYEIEHAYFHMEVTESLYSENARRCTFESHWRW